MVEHGRCGAVAFDYITKVAGDESFLANNTKFYNFIMDNIPWFKKDLLHPKKGWANREELDFETWDDYGSIGAVMS